MRQLSLMAIGLLTAGAMAQPGDAMRIEPGHGDTSPNRINLKRLDLDLRQPTAFQDVYLISSIDAFGTRHNSFIRMDGAVTAAFPRSVYINTPFGLLPDVPPGTIFHIGPIPEPPGKPGYVSPTFIDISVDTQAGPLPPPPPPVVRARSLITDEEYRQRRIEALLTLALER